MSRYFLLTNDIETTSIVNNCLSDRTGELVANFGIPKMLDFLDQHGIKSTFFVTGYFANKFPNSIKSIINQDHEVGSHGFSHEYSLSFDNLSLEQQIEQLKKSKVILENITNTPVISFRAPALRINKYTISALESTGFKIDSSISSQRFDFFLTTGMKGKMKWLTAPRGVYHPSDASSVRKGNSPLFEIPVSAILLPYIGTFMRISPVITRILRKVVFWDAIWNSNPVNFLFHPTEIIDERHRFDRSQRRLGNPISHVLKDVLRPKIKVRNLGGEALDLLEEQVLFFKNRGFRFVTCKEYIKYEKQEY